MKLRLSPFEYRKIKCPECRLWINSYGITEKNGSCYNCHSVWGTNEKEEVRLVQDIIPPSN